MRWHKTLFEFSFLITSTFFVLNFDQFYRLNSGKTQVEYGVNSECGDNPNCHICPSSKGIPITEVTQNPHLNIIPHHVYHLCTVNEHNLRKSVTESQYGDLTKKADWYKVQLTIIIYFHHIAQPICLLKIKWTAWKISSYFVFKRGKINHCWI